MDITNADSVHEIASTSDEDASMETWIDLHLGEPGNEFLCEVDKRYIEDNFNLFGLRELIPHFKTCLDFILDRADSDDDYGVHLDRETGELYGLIHARYIVTKKGQERMLRKFQNQEFGICPMLSCGGQSVLPIGLVDWYNPDDENISPVHVYCPRCNQVMLPARYCIDENSHHGALNGAFIGTTFPHLFLMQFPSEIPKPPIPVSPYVPKVFGFRVQYPNGHHLSQLSSRFPQISNDRMEISPSSNGNNSNNNNKNNDTSRVGEYSKIEDDFEEDDDEDVTVASGAVVTAPLLGGEQA